MRAATERGHDFVSSPKGVSDAALFARSKRTGLPIVTFDTDFLDTVKFPLADTPGRIVLQIFPTVFSFQQERFGIFLSDILPSLEIANKLVIVSSDEVIVREM